MNVLALVVARSGSKALPHKNVRALGGHPLLAYSVAAGRQSKLVTRTMLSTDDSNYARVGNLYGAYTPFLRPAELAQDDTPDLPVFQHALTWLAENDDYHPDLVVHLRPTTPFRQPYLIDRIIQLYIELSSLTTWMEYHPPTSIRGVVKAHPPPYKMYNRISDQSIEPVMKVAGMPEAHNMPRQLLPDVFFHTGQIDCVRPDVILGGSMTGDNIAPMFLDEKYTVDLDTPDDWALAEIKIKDPTLDIVRP